MYFYDYRDFLPVISGGVRIWEKNNYVYWKDFLQYEDIRKVKQEVKSMQQKYCNPKSYHGLSSYGLIMVANEMSGQFPIVFTRYDSDYDCCLVVVNDLGKIENDVHDYGNNKLKNLIHFTECKDPIDFIVSHYDQGEFKGKHGVFFLDSYDKEKLVSSVRVLREKKCPYVLIKEHVLEKDDYFHEKEIAIGNSMYRMYVLVQQPVSEFPMEHYPGVYTVQSKKQFSLIWKNPDLQRLLVATIRKETGSIFHKINLNQIISQCQADDKIYQTLHEEIYRHNFKAPQFERSGRTNDRIQRIKDMLPSGWKPNSLLDIGCAEGSITAPLGEAMNLAPDNIHGCDVRNLRTHEGFQFRVIDPSGQNLPYESESMDLVILLMAIHHFRFPENTLKEVSRILKPGGFMVIREHDCDPQEFAMYLDVVHGLYALVWSKPIEWPDFIETYYAKYFSKSQMISFILDHTNFKLYKETDSFGKIKFYNASFKKEKTKVLKEFQPVVENKRRRLI